MRTLVLFCRLIVGSLFIVSGLIKANDPLGFSYKLEEYFAESALNLPGLMDYALALAILACLAEIVLGFAILFGGRMKVATVAILLLTVFFGWLTYYTATCDPQGTYYVMVNGAPIERPVTCVTDCGCFGDAMKGSIGRSLTPWESFSKDAILMVFLFPILLAAFVRKDTGWNTKSDDKILLPGGLLLVAMWSWIFTWYGPVWITLIGYVGYVLIKRRIEAPRSEWLTAGWASVVSLVFIWWCYTHLPVRDYRPYAVGKNITEQKQSKAPVNQVFVSYRNKTTGKVEEFDSAKPYPWDDPNYEAVENGTRVVELEAGMISPVQDFRLTDRDDYDLTDDVLHADQPVLLITAYDLTKTDTGNLAAIAKLANDAQAKGWYVYGVCTNGWEVVDEFRHEHQLAFEFVRCDEKVIKTMVRANPGIMVLKDGTVKGIWHGNDAPTFEEAEGKVK
ncbi:MAG: DoxX family membrane protein [Flavobacteriales bacterium]|nr:DoxX family membrane protein [Flavobacteriales bacterium]